VKHRLGIGPDALRAINPRLVYASISGFGQDGPYAGWPGFDSIAQGMGGLMSVTGNPGDGPMRVGIPLADLCAGHFCAMGILTALLEREASGEGQWVQTSLLESQIAMLDFQAAQWLIDGRVPGQHGNEHPLTVPTGVFTTSDGYINLAAIGQTIDPAMASGEGIPIELRPGREIVTHLSGWKPERPSALLPGQDVTPAARITAIVTEMGILEPVPDALAAALAARRARRSPVGPAYQAAAAAAATDADDPPTPNGRAPGAPDDDEEEDGDVEDGS